MARYDVGNGKIFDTESITCCFRERRIWDGEKWISKATGTESEHQRLYRSKKGNWFLEHVSDCRGTISHCELITPKEAVRWLLLNEYMEREIPEDVRGYIAELLA